MSSTISKTAALRCGKYLICRAWRTDCRLSKTRTAMGNYADWFGNKPPTASETQSELIAANLVV
jgi:hypothetical protein